MPSLATGTVKAAVLFSIGEDKNIPYVSILMQGAPSIVSVREEDIMASEVVNNHPAIEEKIEIDGTAYSIVNIERLEELVKSSLLVVFISRPLLVYSC